MNDLLFDSLISRVLKTKEEDFRSDMCWHFGVWEGEIMSLDIYFFFPLKDSSVSIVSLCAHLERAEVRVGSSDPCMCVFNYLYPWYLVSELEHVVKADGLVRQAVSKSSHCMIMEYRQKTPSSTPSVTGLCSLGSILFSKQTHNLTETSRASKSERRLDDGTASLKSAYLNTDEGTCESGVLQGT